MEPKFFSSQEEFRVWLREHHARSSEIVLGFHKRGTSEHPLTWSQSVDQALCFGWIDGVRGSLGVNGFTVRLTPRKPDSSWSRVNVAIAEALIARGLMEPSGLEAYERRESREGRSLSDDVDLQRLNETDEEHLRANTMASSWYVQQSSGYRRTSARWVNSAKRLETRRNRLAILIADSQLGRKIKPLRRPGDQ